MSWHVRNRYLAPQASWLKGAAGEAFGEFGPFCASEHGPDHGDGRPSPPGDGLGRGDELNARGLMYKAGDGEACIQVRWGLPEGGGRVDGVRGPALGEGREFVMKGCKAKQTPLKCKHVVPWLLPQEMYTVSGNRISITKEGERQVLELNFVRFGVI